MAEWTVTDARAGDFVCCDWRMEGVLATARIVAGTDATVLLTGETGTGKTLVARLIHEQSSRAGRPFVELSCGTLTETLLESELFGHVRGAFSGAVASKKGRFEVADRGTVFLDEIGLASPSLQMKLLRVLETFQFEPVGSTQTRKVDVRLILATNADLGRLLSEGRFREDLYYRINVMHIAVPPLRKRREDILPLVLHFIRKHGQDARCPVNGVSDEAARLLVSYPWPGNVRQLENVMRRALLLCRSPEITPELLDIAVSGPLRPPPPLRPEVLPLREAVRREERRHILVALDSCRGNRKAAARLLGINRTTLYSKLHEYEIMDA